MASPAMGFLHVVRIGGDIDPVNAVYRIAFAPLDGSLRRRQAQREGLDSLTDFLRQGRCPDSGDRTDVAGSREAPGSLHPAYRADACPGRGARALAPPDDATGDEAMGVYSELRGFALAHRGCGELHGNADPLTPEGYRLWARCSCGARFERSVTPADAEADLLRSALLAFEN